MLGVLLLGASAVQMAPTISYQNSVFQIREGQRQLEISLGDASLDRMFPAEKITLSYAGKEVSFDSGGMHVKRGNTVFTSRLPAIVSSNKVFTAEQIKANQALIKSGERQAEFTGLSGYQMVGSNLYLLLRWDDKKGTPWLETLVRMDMSADVPAAEYVGQFAGFSFAKGIVDDRLNEEAGQLTALVANSEGWGLSRFDLGKGEADLLRFGPPVSTARFMGGNMAVAGLTATGYNSTLVTWVDLVTRTNRPVAEVKGAIKDLIEPHYLRFVRNGEHWLLNLWTGAELRIEETAQERETDLGLLLWWPADEPKHAVILESETFRPKAGWHAAPGE